MGLLEGNVTLITGGGSGLGRAIVRRFIREGAKVGVLERSPEKCAELTSEFPDDVRVTVGDVTAGEDNAAAVAATISAFGKLDTFIGNAGVWDFGTSLVDLPRGSLGAAFDELFGVNVKGYLLGARASIEALRDSEGGMIFTLSNAAFLPGGGGPLYVSSKHAVVGLIRQLAYELENQVRVNGVAPGIMATDLRGTRTLSQDTRSLGGMLDAIGGSAEKAQLIGKKFFPSPDDYVMGYVVLASNESRMTSGAVFQMHGMLAPLPWAPA